MYSQLVGHAASPTESDASPFSITVISAFEVIKSFNKVGEVLHSVEFADQVPGLILIGGGFPPGGKWGRGHWPKFLQRHSLRGVFDIKIQTPVLIDHDHRRGFFF